MDELTGLSDHRSWRLAVWSLRLGYVALLIVVIGLVIEIRDRTIVVLEIGVIVWLLCAAMLATGFVATLSALQDSRPGFWEMRGALLRDSVRRRPRP